MSDARKTSVRASKAEGNIVMYVHDVIHHLYILVLVGVIFNVAFIFSKLIFSELDYDCCSNINGYVYP